MINNYPIINIYEQNSLRSKISSQLLFGEKFQILKKKNEWLKIRTSYDKYIGYIKRRKFTKNLKITHKITSLKANLYSNQKKWAKGSTIEELNSNLSSVIKLFGKPLDEEKCYSNTELEAFILNERIEGVKEFDINSTPTLILNDQKFEKTLSFKNLKKAIEKLL